MITQPIHRRGSTVGHWLVLAAFAVAGVSGLAGCAQHKPPGPEVLNADPTTEQQQQSAMLVKGQKLALQLPVEPRSGYAWRMTGKDWGHGVVDVIDHRADLAAGNDVYNFQALKPGEAQIQFVYARPLQKPTKSVTLDVTVR